METKLILAGILIGGLMALFAGTAVAATDTFTCTVDLAGSQGSAVNVVLSHSATAPVFTKKYFKAAVGQENRVLAVALAAMTTKKKVTAVVDPAAPDTPEIVGIYLKP